MIVEDTITWLLDKSYGYKEPLVDGEINVKVKTHLKLN